MFSEVGTGIVGSAYSQDQDHAWATGACEPINLSVLVYGIAQSERSRAMNAPVEIHFRKRPAALEVTTVDGRFAEALTPDGYVVCLEMDTSNRVTAQCGFLDIGEGEVAVVKVVSRGDSGPELSLTRQNLDVPVSTDIALMFVRSCAFVAAQIEHCEGAEAADDYFTTCREHADPDIACERVEAKEAFLSCVEETSECSAAGSFVFSGECEDPGCG